MLCGGSGLYVKAVTHGLDEHPSDLSIRRKLIELFEAEGIAFLQNELLRLDPKTHGLIDRHNHQRMIRALEVCLATGRPYSDFLTHSKKVRPFKTIALGLNLPREVLMDRINRRVDEMVEKGLVEEARKLYPMRHLNALQTVGYKELFLAFDGKYSVDEAIETIKVSTRKFAKRQVTWFQKYIDAKWFDPADEDAILDWLTSQIK